MALREEWQGFSAGHWTDDVNVRDFIQRNYAQYDGDESFLAGPTEATDKLWGKVQELQAAERANGGVLDCETEIVSGLTAYGPGYIDPQLKDLEKVVGLQTDKPLKRAFMPYGGIKMAQQAAESYGYKINPKYDQIFNEYRKTHNQAVFDAYTPEMRAARHSHVITGLPDTYGRGRIVGDYRRVALYGIDFLIAKKQEDLLNCGDGTMVDDVIRLREEIAEQIRALRGMKEMAKLYGYDISQPARDAHEAVQWLYFGYLAAIKTQNGAAMSVGRISTFLDIYIQRDLEAGKLDETQAQELIDHLVLKFRMVKFARIPSYNELFSGDPVWATLEVAGLGQDGRHMVTKSDFRFLHTLEDMGPAPEPNLTVLYSKRLPEAFRRYAAKISITTSSIQYENDDVMRPVWGDDYSICCCVSATQTGKEMQFFGARANLAKCLNYAINGGRDLKYTDKQGNHMQVGPELAPITSEYLDYDEVMHKFDIMMDWLAGLYVNILDLIQYMHDKYYYEAAEMALIDTDVRRTFATGIAGFSHVVDSLSAIKYAHVRTVRDESGLVVDYVPEGDFPRYGNDDDRADDIAVWLLKTFMTKIRKHHTYRNSEPTTSILTITSNVVYGKATGALPDGRPAYKPFSPGANPSYGAEKNGLLASLNSVAKLPYEYALDGISNTQTINPGALGTDEEQRAGNLVNVLDGYFANGAHHLNVNVFGVEKLKDAMEHPEKPEYANFTIRVSGYAVKFIDLTREQQLDVIARTCHDHM
ncbi:MAG: formate C-acetyltransferase [Coriobacteriaceae bacterium]|uniref:formate C-acetyltransferase n=1 Tax=Tractidigestivibacter sp. TaxID=2847320 RepID=UPI002A90AADC|nr:formate C-acetyltransferase [Tractidigestivibacter sp.]MCI7437764.1 formate C-acetyltransferase [Coriobacteriaceae bacterium]MDY5270937.1 formate C-acetyltransferase [Tractidigestivibacter sp.]